MAVFLAFVDFLAFDFAFTFLAFLPFDAFIVFAGLSAFIGSSADMPAGRQAFINIWRSAPTMFCALASASQDAREVCALAEAAKNGSDRQVAINSVLNDFFIGFPLKVRIAFRAKGIGSWQLNHDFHVQNFR